MTTAAPQLDYAPGAPIRRRRRVLRVLVLLLVAGFVLAVWWFHAPVWQHAKIFYYERQCLNYIAPPEQVVYDENNGAVSPLVGTAGYRGVPFFHGADQQGVVPVATVAVRPAPELGNYFAAIGYPMSFTPATVFLHELRSKSGQLRLVAVTRWPVDTGHSLYEFGLLPSVIGPAGLTSHPVPYPMRVGSWSGPSWMDWNDTQNLRFYAGQPDPADPAHFTIKYDLRKGSGIIDGRLNEDGQTVSLKIVSGPALGTGWVVDGDRR